jgi:hypothetical protein
MLCGASERPFWGLLGSDHAGTALARQHFVAGSWQIASYQLNVFALT